MNIFQIVSKSEFKNSKVKNTFVFIVQIDGY